MKQGRRIRVWLLQVVFYAIIMGFGGLASHAILGSIPLSKLSYGAYMADLSKLGRRGLDGSY